MGTNTFLKALQSKAFKKVFCFESRAKRDILK